jgi:tetratricopeptide (TPR) repeat protein
VLAWDVFRYARLFESDALDLDPTDDNIAGNLAFIFMSLGDAYRQQGDIPRMIENYKKANHLSHDPRLQEFLQQLQAAGQQPLPGLESAGAGADSARQPPAASRGGGRRDTSKR